MILLNTRWLTNGSCSPLAREICYLLLSYRQMVNLTRAKSLLLSKFWLVDTPVHIVGQLGKFSCLNYLVVDRSVSPPIVSTSDVS